jgi:hypothetical protein
MNSRNVHFRRGTQQTRWEHGRHAGGAGKQDGGECPPRPRQTHMQRCPAAQQMRPQRFRLSRSRLQMHGDRIHRDRTFQKCADFSEGTAVCTAWLPERKSKVLRLKLKKTAPAAVTARPVPRTARSAPTPKPLSAAVAGDQHSAAPVLNGSCTVPLLDRRAGQCRWIVSRGPPAMYCGARVVRGASSISRRALSATR